jgi:Tol biopolymer transport system component
MVSASFPSGDGDTDASSVIPPPADGGRLRDERPGLSQGFLRVVERALASRPEQRFASAGEMERELAVALASSGSLRVSRPAAGSGVVRRRGLLATAGFAAAGIAAVTYLGFASKGAGTAGLAEDLADRPGEDAGRRPEARPLTSYPGAELQPALSPQGERVAFQWRGSEQNDDIYVKLVSEEPPLRLTDDRASECCPAWSPDGQRIAFIRSNGPRPGIYDVPSFGGRERLLQASEAWFGSALSWTPDGEELIYSAAVPGEPSRLWRLPLETLQPQPVTTPPRSVLGDAFPSVSPDGRSVAFSRIEASGDLLTVADIFVSSADGSPPRRLTSLGRFIGGLDWTPDGSRIAFSARDGEVVEILSVSAGGGQPQVLKTPWPSAIDRESESPGEPSRAFRLSYARSRPLLAYASSSFDLDIWRLSLPALESRQPLIASTFSDTGPSISPDGLQIAFESRRTGSSEVWTCGSAGTGCDALTQLGGHNGSPSWSPDGRLIAFDARPHGNADIFIVDVVTRRPRRLTTDGAQDVVPSWSADGRRIFFSSDRSGRWEIWSQAVEAGRPAVQVTRAGGFSASQSPDGRWLYHARIDEPGLWRMPIAGGPGRRITGDVGCWGYWAVGGRGIYLVNTSLEQPLLELLPWGKDIPLPLGEVLELPACGDRGLAVAPDERSLLLARVDLAEGDVLSLDDPR